MQSSRKAHYLQIAAFIVAIFRYMGMGGMAIGHNVFEIYGIFVIFEIVSWGAMAILEGFAMPFISKGMRQFPVKSFYWYQLLVYRIILLAAIPLLGAPLYAAVSRNSSIDEVLSSNHPVLFWGWLLLFSGLTALIVDGVGIVDELQPTVEELKPNPVELKPNAEELRIKAWGLLSQSYARGEWLYPPSLVKLMGETITEQQAVSYISEWYESLPKRPGVKPEGERELVKLLQQPISLNGNLEKVEQ